MTEPYSPRARAKASMAPARIPGAANGNVTFGVTGDYDAVPDLSVLCRGIEDEMGELVELSA